MSNSQPVWQLRLANSKTFEDITILTQARNRQTQLYLNKPGSFVFDLPLEHEEALLVDPVRTCVKAYRNGELVWSGPVWTIQDSAPDNKTQVSCIGWFELLNHRIILSDKEYNDDAGKIAFSLYAETLDYNYIPNDIRFTNGDFSGGVSLWGATGGTISGNSPYPPFAPTQKLVATFPPGGTYCNIFTTNSPTNSFSGEENLIANNNYSLSFGYSISFDTINSIDMNVAFYDSSFVYLFNKTYNSIKKATTGEFVINFKPESDIPLSELQLSISITNPSGNTVGANYIFLDNFFIKKNIYDIPVTIGSYELTQNRVKTYTKFSNVGQEITNLSEIEAGFDFEVNPINRKLNIYEKIGNYLSIELGYNHGSNNIKSISITQDGSRMVNSVVAIGSTNASPPYEDEDKQAVYGKFMETVSAPNTTEDIILAAYANEEVALRSDPLVTYDIVPMPSGPDNIPQPFDDYNIGDIIFFSAKKGRIQIDSQAIRIFGMSISIDDNGIETVSSIQTRADG